MTSQTIAQSAVDPEKAALNKRLETAAWGLFLIMLGGFALIPEETIPKGAWSIKPWFDKRQLFGKAEQG